MKRDPFDLVGDVLDGQFRVDAFAGEGDLSVVYKGHHLGVDAPVAIKCLNLPDTLDPALARPLVDGFKQASSVHYRLARGNLHIAQTIASGLTLVPRSGVVVPYLVREWFEGESLASDLARRRAEKRSGRSVEETLSLLETAFDGIAHAHAEGEMHLSINPSNLFVVGQAGATPSPRLKVLDFGVARTMNTMASGIPSGARPGAGLRLLFPAYAAPEQLDRGVGALGPWTDVYAIALVMMEVLSDRPVMREADSGAIVEHALDENRRPTPAAHGLKLPSHIERALNRAVARAPAKRQKSAAELWKDVRNTARTIAPRSMSPGSMTPTAMPSRTPAPMPSLAADAMPARSPATMPVPSRTPMPFPSHLTVPVPAHAAQTQAPKALSTPWQTSAPGPVRATIPMPALSPRTVPGLSAAHRVRAQTLVGLSPPTLPPVPGAAENRQRPPASPSVSTRPMSFEPRAATPPPALAMLPDLPSVAPQADSVRTTAAADHAQADAVPIGHELASPPAVPVWHRETLPAPSLPSTAPAPALPSTAPAPSPFYAGPPPASHWRSPYSNPPAEDPAPPAPVGPGVTPSSDPSAGIAPPRQREDWDGADSWQTPPTGSPGLLGKILTPRSTPIVLTIAGGLFWCWGFSVFVWVVVMPWRHARPATTPAAIAATSAPAPSDVASSEPAPALAAAPLAAATPATAPAPAPEPPASPAPEPVAAASQGSPFKPAAAIRALDGKWRDIAKCRRGKIWGKASTTVTFANDGAVTHVDVGSPFAGTPTADCIVGALTSVHVAPFGDTPAPLVYRVYVAPK